MRCLCELEEEVGIVRCEGIFLQQCVYKVYYL